MNKLHINRILLVLAALLFLIIFPYTKEIERFKADDLKWTLLNTSVSHKEFDPKVFAFRDTYQISPELRGLNNKEIVMKGFLKQHKHKDHIDIVLTENASDVCFMCDHDEHKVFISVSAKKPGDLNSVPNDIYVELKGIFRILTSEEHGLFHLTDAELINIIKEEK